MGYKEKEVCQLKLVFCGIKIIRCIVCTGRVLCRGVYQFLTPSCNFPTLLSSTLSVVSTSLISNLKDTIEGPGRTMKEAEKGSKNEQNTEEGNKNFIMLVHYKGCGKKFLSL